MKEAVEGNMCSVVTGKVLESVETFCSVTQVTSGTGIGVDYGNLPDTVIGACGYVDR